MSDDIKEIIEEVQEKIEEIQETVEESTEDTTEAIESVIEVSEEEWKSLQNQLSEMKTQLETMGKELESLKSNPKNDPDENQKSETLELSQEQIPLEPETVIPESPEPPTESQNHGQKRYRFL